MSRLTHSSKQVFDDEEDGEKQLQLVDRERVRVLGDQVRFTLLRGILRTDDSSSAGGQYNDISLIYQ